MRLAAISLCGRCAQTLLETLRKWYPKIINVMASGNNFRWNSKDLHIIFQKYHWDMPFPTIPK